MSTPDEQRGRVNGSQKMRNSSDGTNRNTTTSSGFQLTPVAADQYCRGI